MKETKIKNVESTSIGKVSRKNDDDIYIGENFAAVIDGVSNKSSIEINGKEIRIAGIITEALKKIDRPSAPTYAKELTFEEFVKYINMYIRKYCERYNISLTDKLLEATGVIYSKFYNQIWLVGDCRATYDDCVVEHELKIDEVYANIRVEIVKALLRDGYTEEELFEEDFSKSIIVKPETIPQYIKDDEKARKLQEYIADTMYQALLKSGFSKDEIEEQGLAQKYNNPKKLQDYLKNNPNAGEYGYAVFNGINTEVKNCIVQDLPSNVKTIKLSSDGFPISSLMQNKDLGYAIRRNRILAKKDPLSIKENKSVKKAVRQSDKSKFLAMDDASAVCIEIKHIEERDDER